MSNFNLNIQILKAAAQRQSTRLLGGSPGLVLKGGDSCSEGHGFESGCRILDGHDIFSH